MTAEMAQRIGTPVVARLSQANQSASTYVLPIQAATALGPCMQPAATRSVCSCVKAMLPPAGALQHDAGGRHLDQDHSELLEDFSQSSEGP